MSFLSQKLGKPLFRSYQCPGLHGIVPWLTNHWHTKSDTFLKNFRNSWKFWKILFLNTVVGEKMSSFGMTQNRTNGQDLIVRWARFPWIFYPEIAQFIWKSPFQECLGNVVWRLVSLWSFCIPYICLSRKVLNNYPKNQSNVTHFYEFSEQKVHIQKLKMFQTSIWHVTFDS